MVKLFRLAAVIFCCAAILFSAIPVSAEDIALTGAPLKEINGSMTVISFGNTTIYNTDGYSFGFRSNLPELSETADYVLQATISVNTASSSPRRVNPFTEDINYLDFVPARTGTKRSSTGNGMGVATVQTNVTSSGTVYTVLFRGADILALEEGISYLYLLAGYNRQGNNYLVDAVSFDVFAMSADNGALDYIIANIDELIELQRESNAKLDDLIAGVELIQTTGMEFVDDIPDGSELADAESQLNSAEQEIESTSNNLRTQAADGIVQSASALSSTLTYLSNTGGFISGTITTALDAVPSDVQPAFFGIPLLGFGVWLLGLRR